MLGKIKIINAKIVIILLQSVKLTCRQNDIRTTPGFTQTRIDQAVKSSAWFGGLRIATISSSVYSIDGIACL